MLIYSVQIQNPVIFSIQWSLGDDQEGIVKAVAPDSEVIERSALEASTNKLQLLTRSLALSG